MNKTFNPALPEISAALEKIASDNKSGAAEILRRTVEVFSTLESAQSERPLKIQQARRLIVEISAALIQAQPGMAPIANLASCAVAAAVSARRSQQVIEAASQAARKFFETAAQAADEAASRAARLIKEGSTVLTHSRSSTVIAAFLEAERVGRRFNVIATESRPLLEGRALAKTLAREAVTVTMIADAAAAAIIDRADFVLVGADEITSENVINKIGTWMIALAARQRGCPVYAVCDTSKFLNRSEIDYRSSDEHNADELWPNAPQAIAVLNRYFEPTPLACFTRIITEDGLLTRSQAARRATAASIDQTLANAIIRSRRSLK